MSTSKAPGSSSSSGRLAANSICVRLREAREARGMTPSELARQAGISPTAVAYLEKGEKLPRADTVERLARALRVSRCWLAFGDGHKPDFNQQSGRACGTCGRPAED